MRKYIEVLFCRSLSVLKDETSVLVLLTAFETINALTIIGFIKVVLLDSDHILLPRLYQISIYLGIGSLNYYYFLLEKKHQLVCKKYSDVDASRLGNRIIITYMVLTILLLVGLVLVVRMRY